MTISCFELSAARLWELDINKTRAYSAKARISGTVVTAMNPPRPGPLNEHDYYNSTWDTSESPNSTNISSEIDEENPIDKDGLQVR
jgi:hypothetical protein